MNGLLSWLHQFLASINDVQFLGDGWSEMTPKNRTLEGQNRTLGGGVGGGGVKNRLTSLMDDPLYHKKFYF
jgi:hypothetical protein